MNRFLLTALFFWQTVFLQGQTTKGINDSVFQISEVTITSNRLAYFSIGNKIRTLDSSLIGSYATSNLAQTLSAYSQVQLNSYGVGLSSLSLRGTGSSHTAVLWNGFNLQDLLNGGVDCSLLPMNFFDDIKVQYGGCSALYGSGTIGGAIHLNNTLNFDKGLTSSISAGYGSFDNVTGGLNLAYGKGSYSGMIRSFYNTAQNDFKFKFSQHADAPTGIMTNAERQQYGILAGNAFKLGNQSKLESYVWFQDNDKNIAPTILTFGSGKYDNQRDRFLKATASWKIWNEQSDFTLRTGFSDYRTIWDSLRYNSLQSSTQAEYNLKISRNHLFNSGLDYTFEHGEAKNLLSNAHRNRMALFTSYRFTTNDAKLQLAINFRDEVINEKITPFTFSVGLEYQATQLFMLKGVLSKNYRVPTFNDLYWFPGGNPNLKNESGLNQELGFVYTPQWNAVIFRYDFTLFNNWVSNWLLWQPSTNDQNLWTPVNVNKVWSRGAENDLSVSYHWNKLLIKTSLSYTYTRSTKEKASSPGDNTYHKQLIYVPVHKGLASLSLKYNGYTFYYAHGYTGQRYSSQDNIYSVDPYVVSNLSISKNFKYEHYLLNIGFQVNNVWNTSYQVMPYYPMPLRNFQLNLKLNL